MSGGSKGGHANLDNDAPQRPNKTMISFENVVFDVWDIKRYELGTRYNSERHNGMEFTINLNMSSYPFEIVLGYATQEKRDEAVKRLKSKLIIAGVVTF